MKVLFISNDPLLFDADSAVRARMREYASLFGELHVVSRAPRSATKVREGNLTLYPAPGFWSLFLSARRIVREHAINVVSAQDPFEHGLVAYFAHLQTSAKLHIQLHTDLFSPYFRRSSWWNAARVFIAHFIFRHADGIRVISERLKNRLEASRHKLSVISVVPIFTDIEKFRALPRLKHPRFKVALLVVSRLEKEKNVSLAVRALKNARDAGHDAGLTIVGDGRERALLQALIYSLGLERFVEFVGRQNDIEPHLSTADLLLFPSHYDGYGLAVIEALAAGVPVLATDVGVAREAGAIITSQDEFSKTLVRWIESGPRQGELYNYPYANKKAYLEQFRSDLELCAKKL